MTTTFIDNDNEVYRLLVGVKLKVGNNIFFGSKFLEESEQEGNHISVQFDWEQVIERHKARNDIVGFFHTHPNFRNGPSTIDLRTMYGWVEALGKPLLCAIEGVNGLACHWFYPGDYFETYYGFRLNNFVFGKYLK